MLLNYWAKTNSDELAKRIKKYQKAYGNKYRESANELVNDTLAEIFANEKAMRDMAAWMAANENKANAKTIKQVITDYIQTIKDIIADIKNLKKQGLTYDSRLKFTDEECDKLMKAITTAMDDGIASRDRVASEGKQANVSEEARNSLVTLSDGTQYIQLDGNLFDDGKGGELTPREAYRKIASHYYILQDGEKLYFERFLQKTEVKDLYDELFKKRPSKYQNIADIKTTNTNINKNIIELFDNSRVTSKNEKPFSDHSKYGIKDFDERTVLIADDNGAYTLKLIVANLEDGRKVAYAKRNLAFNEELYKKIKAETMGKSRQNQPLDSSIASDTENASRNYLDIDANKEVSNILASNSAKGRNSIGVDTPVSANDDLVAVHNMMPEELLQTLKLGGFPSPSIAVIRANMEHSKYGTVSIVFGRDTIDPKKKAANKVYGGDAWTPTFPTIEYQANENTLRKVVKYLEDNVPTQILSAEGYMGLDADNAEDYLNRNGGDIKRSYENKLPMMYAFYTASDGLGKTILEFPTRQVSLSKFPDASYSRIAELLGADLAEAKQDSSYYTSRPEVVAQLLNIVNEEKWLNFSKDKEGLSKRSEEVIEKYKHFYDKLSFSDFDKLINATSQYVDNNYQLPTEIDYYVLKDALKEEISDHKDAYEKWLDNLFEGIVKREGIYNNKDFYTPSGNRRSWDALHMPVTLENIVKAMNFRDAKGDALFSQSAIQAIATKDFESIDDIKKNINMLQMLSDEEYKDISDRLYERYKEVSNKLLPEDASWEEMDRVAYLISDTIRTKKTAPAIYKELHKYNQLATPEIAQEIVDLMDDISNRATGYFEAKPQRAVYLDEILKAVVPSDATELIEELKAQKIPFETYELGDEEARTKAVNETEGGRFSLSVDADSAENEPHYLSDVLSPQEYNQVKSWIDSKKQPSFIAKNGDKVLRLDNKLVYTDGEENIGISKIVTTQTKVDVDINAILDTYTDYEKGILSHEELFIIAESVFGKGVLREYTSEGSFSNGRYDRPTERGKSISDAYHAARQQNGARVYLKDGEIVRKSLEVDDRYEIKLGDASPYADSISEMYVIKNKKRKRFV